MVYEKTPWKDKEDPTFDKDLDPEINAYNLMKVEQGIYEAHLHMADKVNPHSVTKGQVGLGNVTDDAQLKASQLETSITDSDTKIPSSGAVVDYVAAHAGTGDMQASTYDTDGDGKVNAAASADTVPWTGVSDKPSTFPPEVHNHDTAYAGITHNHDGTYSPEGHNHDLAYAGITHNHDAAYASITHLHDSNYAAIGHNHDTEYSAIGHDHSGVYEPVISTKKSAFNVDFGTLAGTACQGNDGRLSDARTPLSHSHGIGDLSAVVTTISDDDTKIPTAGAVVDYVSGMGGGDMLESVYDTNGDGKVNSADSADSVPWTGISDKPSVFPPDTHNHDTAYSAIGHNHSGVYEPVIATKGTAFNKDFGTGSQQVAEGNHTHSVYALTTHNHDTAYATATHNHDTAYASITHDHDSDYAAIGHNHDSAYSAIGHNHSGVYEPAFTKNTAFNKDFGTASGTVCQGNDSRLTNDRTPTSHALTHVGGGTDAIANATTSVAGLMSSSDKSKLDGIESNATADMSGSEIVSAINGSASLVDDDNIAATIARYSARPFSFSTGHTEWATGLSSVEIGRIQLQSGETLYVQRVELQIKGGGTSSSLTVDVYNSTGSSVVASTTAGAVNTTGGTSAAAALILIRLSNSTGSTQNAAVTISGWIR